MPERTQRIVEAPALRGRAGAAAAVALAFVCATPAHAQSAWAKGDRAFREGRYPSAESLYALRARRAGPAAVRVNRATARALAGRGASAESLLATLKDASGTAGPAASYNLGTLEARGNRLDDALRSLRHSLELDPTDADARYNYELALRRQREQQRQRAGGPPPTPSPATPRPQGAGRDPTAGAQSPPPPNAPLAPQPQSPGSPSPGPEGMDRRAAEQLLGSLSELERLEQQRLRKVRVVRERRGKDW